MGLMRAAIRVGNAVGELLDGEEAIGFKDASLAVDPGGLNGIEPGALDRQVAGDDARCLVAEVDRSDHASDLTSGVPRRRAGQSASTVALSPASIFSQFARECSAASADELLSWLSRTLVRPSWSSSSYVSVW